MSRVPCSISPWAFGFLGIFIESILPYEHLVEYALPLTRLLTTEDNTLVACESYAYCDCLMESYAAGECGKCGNSAIIVEKTAKQTESTVQRS